MSIIKSRKVQVFLFCFILSFLVLMICSKSSFLYPLNDWVDANAFFTMGKSLFNEKIIFKDIFEQKGPFLYLIYGIGYLISNKSFLGVFFLEVLSSTVFLYYTHKIINLYLEEKYSYIILPLFAFLVYTSIAFRHGSSCEEFCFPFLLYTVYQLLLFTRNKDIGYLNVFIVGLFAGIIFLMKYTLLGVSFGFIFFVFIYYLKQKKIKKAIIASCVFLGGMFIPMIPWLIYFLVNEALYDFLNTYIFINIFSYASSENVSFIERLINCFTLFIKNLNEAYIHGVVTLLGIILFTRSKINFSEKLALGCIFLFSIIFIYIGGIYYLYYVLPLLVFIIFALVGAALKIKYDIKISLKLLILYVIFILFCSYFASSNTYLLGKSKKDLVQYQFADIILEKDDATILNYGWLDSGFYTVTGIVPDTKYFHTLNFDYEKYPDNMDSLNQYIKDKIVDFVIVVVPEVYNYYIPPYLNVNYDKIKECFQKFEGANISYSLYQLKNKEN